MKHILAICLFFHFSVTGQIPVDLSQHTSKNGAHVTVRSNIITASWPAGKGLQGNIAIDLNSDKPLFQSLSLIEENKTLEIGRNIDPVFLLTVGKRDLISQNGWNIFFDKVPLKPFESHLLHIQKKSASVISMGSRTT